MSEKLDKKISNLSPYFIHDSVFLFYFIWFDFIKGKEIENINYSDFNIYTICVDNNNFLLNYFELSLLSINNLKTVNYKGVNCNEIACIYLSDCVKRLRKIEDKAIFFKNIFLDNLGDIKNSDLKNAFKMSNISTQQYAKFLQISHSSLKAAINNLSRD